MSAATQAQKATLSNEIKLGRAALIDAIKMDTAVAGKWKIAAERLAAAFGASAFLTKKEEGYDETTSDALKNLVGEVVGIPHAPTAKEDASEEGVRLRYEKQKAQMKINTYLSRMKSYLVPDAERQSAGAPKTPKEVFSTVAKRINNLYFKKGEGAVTPVSPEFGRDIRCLVLALETMATAPKMRFDTAYEAAKAKMEGIDEKVETAVAALQDRQTPVKKTATSKKGAARPASQASH